MRDDNSLEGEDRRPAMPPPLSKSQRKRDATALQGLGEQLVKLTPAQLSHVPLTDALLTAVRLAQTITQRGGHKRQLQYIGKLMRQLDATETEAIRAALAARRTPRRSLGIMEDTEGANMDGPSSPHNRSLPEN